MRNQAILFIIFGTYQGVFWLLFGLEVIPWIWIVVVLEFWVGDMTFRTGYLITLQCTFIRTAGNNSINSDDPNDGMDQVMISNAGSSSRNLEVQDHVASALESPRI